MFSAKPDPVNQCTACHDSRVGNEFYGADPIHGYGYGQDEDQGQLGAWYVMASIGLFDVAGLTGENPSMQIGSPAFDEITIQLNPDYYSGKTFTIETQNNSPENVFVNKVLLNNEPIKGYQRTHDQITRGGNVVLEMLGEINK